MEIQKDFKELLELFNSRKIEYIIVGGYALAFHGAPRTTGDLDLFIKADKENAKRVCEALKEFGFGETGIAEEDFARPDSVVQLGFPPIRIDILTSLSGVSWEEAEKGRQACPYAGVPVNYLGLDQFVKNKKALGRQRDLADIESLGKIK